MFDCLRAADNRGVENNFILYFPSKPVRFLDEAVYTGTVRLPLRPTCFLSRLR